MDLLLYLSKSAAIITIFYGVYFVTLRTSKNFIISRHYLLSGIIAAIVLPTITFTKTIYLSVAQVAPLPVVNNFIPATPTPIVEASPVVTWWQLLVTIYAMGVLLLFGRLVMQLLSLFKMLRKTPSEKHGSHSYIKVSDRIAPFSFFDYIVFNPSLHTEEELKMILEHEKVHANQWHSIDILMAHIFRIFQWVNPLSWIYKKHIETNLEFIADSETAQKVSSKKAYQLVLVKASSTLPVPALTSNFYQSNTCLKIFGKAIELPTNVGQVKKRIIMLNKSNSKSTQLWRVGLLLPLLALFLWSFNVKEEIKYVEKNKQALLLTGTSTDKPQFNFNALSSNAELDAIETYFVENIPELLIKIDDRKRNENGELINFSFKTKFAGDDRFYTRFDRGDETPFKTNYQLEPQGNFILLVSELGPNGTQFKITRNNMEMLLAEGQGLDISTEKAVATAATAKKPAILGDNPLYIINGKEYRQANLPKHKSIELDGFIETLNKQEGRKKYGTKGNDGVLIFKGIATFVSEPLDDSVNRNASIKPTDYKDVIKKTITKNTTDTELTTLKKELKQDYGAKLKFKTKRNNANEIIAIKISYSWDDQSGTFNVSDDDGIQDFMLLLDQVNNHFGFYNENNASSSQLHEHRKALVRQRNELRDKSRTVRNEQRELAQSNRKELLGEAKRLREEARQSRKEMLAATTVDAKEAEEVRAQMLQERKELREKREQLQEERNYWQEKRANVGLERSRTTALDVQDNDPIYVVDGQIRNSGVSNLNPKDIKSVQLLKGDAAIDAYGDRAKNGVIEITLYKLGEHITNTNNPLTRSYVTDMLNNEGIFILKDGQEISKQDFQNLDPESITSIFTAQPEKAMEKFGAKASNGAIVVTTKSN